jgi:hypothetical protein
MISIRRVTGFNPLGHECVPSTAGIGERLAACAGPVPVLLTNAAELPLS